MIDGWSARDDSVHLRFGIEYHAALQEWEVLRAEGVKAEAALEVVIKNVLVRTKEWDPDHKYKNKDNLVKLVIHYLDHFRDDPAKTVMKATGEPMVEQSFRHELDYSPSSSKAGYGNQPYMLCGHLDRVVEFNEEIFVMDHKTTTTTPSAYYFNQYDPNNQMSLYTWAGQIIFKSTIAGVIIDAAQVLIGLPKFVRGVTYRTAAQLEEWMIDLKHWLALAERYAIEGYWPMNDTACDKFGGCPFRPICSKDPRVRETFLKSDFEQKAVEDRWNPLAVR
jgi:hypothetical protein